MHLFPTILSKNQEKKLLLQIGFIKIFRNKKIYFDTSTSELQLVCRLPIDIFKGKGSRNLYADFFALVSIKSFLLYAYIPLPIYTLTPTNSKPKQSISLHSSCTHPTLQIYAI